jgi:uncharacterized protein (DUF433 family)
MERKNMPPSAAPSLRFAVKDQQAAYDELGANCGPGAIAGICGYTPRTVLAHMPEFRHRKHTTEWMLESALDSLAISWRPCLADDVAYGLARVIWGGPWSASLDPYEPLRHSHWVGLCRENEETSIFDINAISVGGWLSIEKWKDHLVSWILNTEEPGSNGSWRFGEAYEVASSVQGASAQGRGAAMHEYKAIRAAADIREDEHPYLHSHPLIWGGRAVVRQTRLSTTSIAGRVDDGESVQDIIDDYPYLSTTTVEVAIGHGRRRRQAMWERGDTPRNLNL